MLVLVSTSRQARKEWRGELWVNAVMGATLAVPGAVAIPIASAPAAPALGQGSLHQGWFPLLNHLRMRAVTLSATHSRRSLMRRGCIDQTPVRRRELHYGSREFLAASDLARRLPYPLRISALIGRVVRDPALIRVLVAIRRLPVVDLRVRQADVDAWSEARFGPARHGRLAQAVLDLPAIEEQYLAGRHKQAVRTNLRHARDLGVTSARIPTYEAWFKEASVVLQAGGDSNAMPPEMEKPEPGQRVAYYVARDAHETPLASAGIALFGQFAVLFGMCSRHDLHPSASFARYQLHTFFALDLGSSGVKHLLVGSALRETAGNQYFQHLLGYRARNLRVEVIESGPRRPARRPTERGPQERDSPLPRVDCHP